MKNLLLVLLVLPFIGFGQKVCISGNCVNGQGTCTYADIPGSKYVGEFMNGKKNGQGTFTWADGAKYVGGWMDGKMHGQGTFTKDDGAIVKGLFKNGKYVGE
jgi:hypothetical protein